MLDASMPLLDPTAVPRVLSFDDALRFGFSRAEIRHKVDTGRWRRILPRTYLTSDTLLWDDKLRAALAYAGPDALLSAAAALCDRGLSSVTRPASILVLVPAGRCPRSTGWVRVRPSARPVRASRQPGLPRATTARAVADLALERRRQDDVRALVAEAVRRRLCSVDELCAELRHTPRRESAFLRQAVDEVGGGAWSAPEARAATLLRRAGVPAFTQNNRIDLPGGSYVYADFLWLRLRAILEIDSDAHHALAGDADGTSDRHLRLETAGYSVIHRTPRLIVRDPAAFTDGVAAWLAARAHELSHPSAR